MSVWVVPPFGCCESCCCEHGWVCISLRHCFQFFWNPEVGWLDYVVVLFLIFWGTSVLFSVTVVPFLQGHHQRTGSQFLHILANTCYFLCMCVFFNRSRPNCCEIVVFCISLMLSDVEHIFICSLAICISYLERWLFKFFACFFKRVILFFKIFI